MKKILPVFIFIFLICRFAYSAENISSFGQIKGEVLDVEELKEPLGSAIYTIKDLSTGDTVKLFADAHRSLVKMGDVTKSVGDVLGGSKVTIIYQKSSKQNLPEVVFVKVTNSYV